MLCLLGKLFLNSILMFITATLIVYGFKTTISYSGMGSSMTSSLCTASGE
jgi:hypothetical protein